MTHFSNLSIGTRFIFLSGPYKGYRATKTCDMDALVDGQNNNVVVSAHTEVDRFQLNDLDLTRSEVTYQFRVEWHSGRSLNSSEYKSTKEFEVYSNVIRRDPNVKRFLILRIVKHREVISNFIQG